MREYKGMSIEQKMDIVRMRIEGRTFQEIANKYGCTRQNIKQLMSRIADGPAWRQKTIYPGLCEWMNANKCTITALATGCKLSYATMNVYLHQPGRIKICAIKAILKYTGLTFEEAFGKEGA